MKSFSEKHPDRDILVKVYEYFKLHSEPTSNNLVSVCNKVLGYYNLPRIKVKTKREPIIDEGILKEKLKSRYYYRIRKR